MLSLKKNKFLAGLVTWPLVAAFLLQGTASAQGVWTPSVLPAAASAQWVRELKLAADLGEIQSLQLHGNGPVILHIQDSHANFDAQQKIAAILTQIAKTSPKPLLIALEGAQGPVSTATLAAWPDAEIRRAAAEYFMRQAALTGAEFYSVTAPSMPLLYGVEDLSLYEENFAAFNAVQQAREKTLAETGEKIARLLSERQKLFSEKQLHFAEKRDHFAAGNLSFKSYAQILGWIYPRETGKPAPELFERAVNCDRWGGQVDSRQIEAEDKAFTGWAQKKWVKEEWAALVEKKISFRMGKIRPIDYFRWIRARLPDAQQYPHLARYAELLELQEQVPQHELSALVRAMEREVEEKLFRGGQERQLELELKIARVTEKLARLEITPEELSFYEENRERFDSPAAPLAEAFYAAARARDAAMVANTLELARRKPDHQLVLVTGGFHTRGMTGLLDRAGRSYAVLAPKLVEAPDEELYRLRMRHELSPLERSLLYGGNRLAPLTPHAAQLPPRARETAELYRLHEVLLPIGIKLGKSAMRDKDGRTLQLAVLNALGEVRDRLHRLEGEQHDEWPGEIPLQMTLWEKVDALEAEADGALPSLTVEVDGRRYRLSVGMGRRIPSAGLEDTLFYALGEDSVVLIEPVQGSGIVKKSQTGVGVNLRRLFNRGARQSLLDEARARVIVEYGRRFPWIEKQAIEAVQIRRIRNASFYARYLEGKNEIEVDEDLLDNGALAALELREEYFHWIEEQERKREGGGALVSPEIDAALEEVLTDFDKLHALLELSAGEQTGLADKLGTIDEDAHGFLGLAGAARNYFKNPGSSLIDFLHYNVIPYALKDGEPAPYPPAVRKIIEEEGINGVCRYFFLWTLRYMSTVRRHQNDLGVPYAARLLKELVELRYSGKWEMGEGEFNEAFRKYPLAGRDLRHLLAAQPVETRLDLLHLMPDPVLASLKENDIADICRDLGGTKEYFPVYYLREILKNFPSEVLRKATGLKELRGAAKNILFAREKANEGALRRWIFDFSEPFDLRQLNAVVGLPETTAYGVGHIPAGRASFLRFRLPEGDGEEILFVSGATLPFLEEFLTEERIGRLKIGNLHLVFLGELPAGFPQKKMTTGAPYREGDDVPRGVELYLGMELQERDPAKRKSKVGIEYFDPSLLAAVMKLRYCFPTQVHHLSGDREAALANDIPFKNAPRGAFSRVLQPKDDSILEELGRYLRELPQAASVVESNTGVIASPGVGLDKSPFVGKFDRRAEPMAANDVGDRQDEADLSLRLHPNSKVRERLEEIGLNRSGWDWRRFILRPGQGPEGEPVLENGPVAVKVELQHDSGAAVYKALPLLRDEAPAGAAIDAEWGEEDLAAAEAAGETTAELADRITIDVGEIEEEEEEELILDDPLDNGPSFEEDHTALEHSGDRLGAPARGPAPEERGAAEFARAAHGLGRLEHSQIGDSSEGIDAESEQASSQPVAPKLTGEFKTRSAGKPISGASSDRFLADLKSQLSDDEVTFKQEKEAVSAALQVYGRLGKNDLFRKLELFSVLERIVRRREKILNALETRELVDELVNTEAAAEIEKRRGWIDSLKSWIGLHRMVVRAQVPLLERQLRERDLSALSADELVAHAEALIEVAGAKLYHSETSGKAIEAEEAWGAAHEATAILAEKEEAAGIPARERKAPRLGAKLYRMLNDLRKKLEAQRQEVLIAPMTLTEAKRLSDSSEGLPPEEAEPVELVAEQDPEVEEAVEFLAARMTLDTQHENENLRLLGDFLDPHGDRPFFVWKLLQQLRTRLLKPADGKKLEQLDPGAIQSQAERIFQSLEARAGLFGFMNSRQIRLVADAIRARAALEKWDPSKINYADAGIREAALHMAAEHVQSALWDVHCFALETEDKPEALRRAALSLAKTARALRGLENSDLLPEERTALDRQLRDYDEAFRALNDKMQEDLTGYVVVDERQVEKEPELQIDFESQPEPEAAPAAAPQIHLGDLEPEPEEPATPRRRAEPTHTGRMQAEFEDARRFMGMSSPDGGDNKPPAPPSAVKPVPSEEEPTRLGAYSVPKELTAQQTMAGEERTNEDAHLTLQLSNGILALAVCDGMGGHEHGAEASKIAVQVFREEVKKIDPAASPDQVIGLLDYAFQRAQAEIHRKLPKKKPDADTDKFEGGGTTAVLAVILPANDKGESEAYVAWAGDSRAYLFNPNAEPEKMLRHLTVDNLSPLREGKDRIVLDETELERRLAETRQPELANVNGPEPLQTDADLKEKWDEDRTRRVHNVLVQMEEGREEEQRYRLTLARITLPPDAYVYAQSDGMEGLTDLGRIRALGTPLLTGSSPKQTARAVVDEGKRRGNDPKNFRFVNDDRTVVLAELAKAPVEAPAAKPKDEPAAQPPSARRPSQISTRTQQLAEALTAAEAAPAAVKAEEKVSAHEQDFKRLEGKVKNAANNEEEGRDALELAYALHLRIAAGAKKSVWPGRVVLRDHDFGAVLRLIGILHKGKDSLAPLFVGNDTPCREWTHSLMRDLIIALAKTDKGLIKIQEQNPSLSAEQRQFLSALRAKVDSLYSKYANLRQNTASIEAEIAPEPEEEEAAAPTAEDLTAVQTALAGAGRRADEAAAEFAARPPATLEELSQEWNDKIYPRHEALFEENKFEEALDLLLNFRKRLPPLTSGELWEKDSEDVRNKIKTAVDEMLPLAAAVITGTKFAEISEKIDGLETEEDLAGCEREINEQAELLQRMAERIGKKGWVVHNGVFQRDLKEINGKINAKRNFISWCGEKKRLGPNVSWSVASQTLNTLRHRYNKQPWFAAEQKRTQELIQTLFPEVAIDGLIGELEAMKSKIEGIGETPVPADNPLVKEYLEELTQKVNAVLESIVRKLASLNPADAESLSYVRGRRRQIEMPSQAEFQDWMMQMIGETRIAHAGLEIMLARAHHFTDQGIALKAQGNEAGARQVFENAAATLQLADRYVPPQVRRNRVEEMRAQLEQAAPGTQASVAAPETPTPPPAADKTDEELRQELAQHVSSLAEAQKNLSDMQEKKHPPKKMEEQEKIIETLRLQVHNARLQLNPGKREQQEQELAPLQHRIVELCAEIDELAVKALLGEERFGQLNGALGEYEPMLAEVAGADKKFFNGGRDPNYKYAEWEEKADLAWARTYQKIRPHVQRQSPAVDLAGMEEAAQQLYLVFDAAIRRQYTRYGVPLALSGYPRRNFSFEPVLRSYLRYLMIRPALPAFMVGQYDVGLHSQIFLDKIFRHRYYRQITDKIFEIGRLSPLPAALTRPSDEKRIEKIFKRVEPLIREYDEKMGDLKVTEKGRRTDLFFTSIYGVAFKGRRFYNIVDQLKPGLTPQEIGRLREKLHALKTQYKEEAAQNGYTRLHGVPEILRVLHRLVGAARDEDGRIAKGEKERLRASFLSEIQKGVPHEFPQDRLDYFDLKISQVQEGPWARVHEELRELLLKAKSDKPEERLPPHKVRERAKQLLARLEAEIPEQMSAIRVSLAKRSPVIAGTEAPGADEDEDLTETARLAKAVDKGLELIDSLEEREETPIRRPTGKLFDSLEMLDQEMDRTDKVRLSSGNKLSRAFENKWEAFEEEAEAEAEAMQGLSLFDIEIVDMIELLAQIMPVKKAEAMEAVREINDRLLGTKGAAAQGLYERAKSAQQKFTVEIVNKYPHSENQSKFARKFGEIYRSLDLNATDAEFDPKIAELQALLDKERSELAEEAQYKEKGFLDEADRDAFLQIQQKKIDDKKDERSRTLWLDGVAQALWLVAECRVSNRKFVSGERILPTRAMVTSDFKTDLVPLETLYARLAAYGKGLVAALDEAQLQPGAENEAKAAKVRRDLGLLGQSLTELLKKHKGGNQQALAKELQMLRAELFGGERERLTRGQQREHTPLVRLVQEYAAQVRREMALLTEDAAFAARVRRKMKELVAGLDPKTVRNRRVAALESQAEFVRYLDFRLKPDEAGALARLEAKLEKKQLLTPGDWDPVLKFLSPAERALAQDLGRNGLVLQEAHEIFEALQKTESGKYPLKSKVDFLIRVAPALNPEDRAQVEEIRKRHAVLLEIHPALNVLNAVAFGGSYERYTVGEFELAVKYLKLAIEESNRRGVRPHINLEAKDKKLPDLLVNVIARGQGVLRMTAHEDRGGVREEETPRDGELFVTKHGNKLVSETMTPEQLAEGVIALAKRKFLVRKRTRQMQLNVEREDFSEGHPLRVLMELNHWEALDAVETVFRLGYALHLTPPEERTRFFLLVEKAKVDYIEEKIFGQVVTLERALGGALAKAAEGAALHAYGRWHLRTAQDPRYAGHNDEKIRFERMVRAVLDDLEPKKPANWAFWVPEKAKVDFVRAAIRHVRHRLPTPEMEKKAMEAIFGAALDRMSFEGAYVIEEKFRRLEKAVGENTRDALRVFPWVNLAAYVESAQSLEQPHERRHEEAIVSLFLRAEQDRLRARTLRNALAEGNESLYILDEEWVLSLGKDLLPVLEEIRKAKPEAQFRVFLRDPARESEVTAWIAAAEAKIPQPQWRLAETELKVELGKAGAAVWTTVGAAARWARPEIAALCGEKTSFIQFSDAVSADALRRLAAGEWNHPAVRELPARQYTSRRTLVIGAGKAISIPVAPPGGELEAAI